MQYQEVTFARQPLRPRSLFLATLLYHVSGQGRQAA